MAYKFGLIPRRCSTIVNNTILKTRRVSSVVPVIDLNSSALEMQFKSAFSGIGFAYIKNHGIDTQLIKEARLVGLSFFQKPLDIKRKYIYRIGKNSTGHNGYTSLGQERETPESPNLLEAFDICSMSNSLYPDEDLPEFREVFTKFYQEGKRVGFTILEMLGRALELKDTDYFVHVHSKVGDGYEKNYSQVRVIYYPPIASINLNVLPEYRIKEHIDYGTFTLLLPDTNGGLEIKQRNGEWYSVPPTQEDYLLLNLGAFFSYWTGDRLRAAPHRVVLPKDEMSRGQHRLSMGIFFHPDADTVIKPLDGSDTISPFVAGEHTKEIYRKTYFTSYEQ